MRLDTFIIIRLYKNNKSTHYYTQYYHQHYDVAE